jgi:hypothetical protein
LVDRALATRRVASSDTEARSSADERREDFVRRWNCPTHLKTFLQSPPKINSANGPTVFRAFAAFNKTAGNSSRVGETFSS